MKYLRLSESIISTNIPDTDEIHSITFNEWSVKRGYDKQENWTNSEVNQLKDIAKIGSYTATIHYKWGRLLIDKSKDEWYLVNIEIWKNNLLSDKPYWICDQFDSLLELIDHLSSNLSSKIK